MDDGRQVDEKLLLQIQAFGAGERAVRPALSRSAALRDPDCDRQWELPFSVATSEGWDDDDKVAWVRVLGVDERLTVVAAAHDSPLLPGQRIASVGRPDKTARTDAEFLSSELVRLRDSGRAFPLRTSEGGTVTVKPFEVCRGYTRFVPPNAPRMQDYHWLLTLHPLEVAEADLTPDEALWLVLWTQGLSEEGGVRMKAWDYGTKLVGTLYNLATLATGIKGAALAAEAAVKTAQAAAAQVATDILRQQLIAQARDFAIDKMREAAADTADRIARAQMVDVMQRAAQHRGALSGVARMAATVFDRADAWAFTRAPRLGGSPLAGFTLHQKLVERSAASNALTLDAERLAALSRLAEAQGLGEQVVAVLRGVRPGEVEAALSRMPLASTPRPFRYDDADDAGAGPFSRGLVEALAGMPVVSGARP